MAETLPPVGLAERCARADCPPQFEKSYGLAGGGIGVYEYCEVCERIVSKTHEVD